MADPRGFISTPRQSPARRPVAERVGDWREVYEGGLGRASLPIIAKQAGRCMDCGVPFCHSGCPLGNLIPEWNDLVWRGEWDEALDRLHATNNFPEFTGRLCPAPCETSCVVAISREAVTIKNVEAAIIDKAWDEHRVVAEPPHRLTSRTVAVVGSGPAGLATAQQLTRIGHTVVVYERDDRIGGLLRYGIPEFKMEKSVLDRRLEQMVDEGTRFETGVEIGRDITGSQLRERFDAVVLATGATVPRELPLEGRGLEGIHQAMDYLVQANRVAVGEQVTGQIHAAGKDVVIVGGGDTGADCLGTAVRQGARSVTLLRRSPEPPTTRPAAEPWPTHPALLEVEAAHEEGGTRRFEAMTSRFVEGPDGRVAGVELVSGGRAELCEGQLVLLALGFSGPERGGVAEQFGVGFDDVGNFRRRADYATDVDGVFACGDAGRGQSLIVWAIAEGRACAHGVDAYLSGSSRLPRPVGPEDRALTP